MRTAVASTDALLAFLTTLPGERASARHVAAVFAHPDDETISCGAALSRLDGVVFVLVTDGSPRDERDAQRLGFYDWETYAGARQRELSRALDHAGVQIGRRHHLGIADQEAAHHLARLTRRFVLFLREHRIRVVVTHAYEGGHPDHDATAFAVHCAVRVLRREDWRIGVVEVPLYHLGAAGAVRGVFAGPPSAEQVVVPLDLSQLSLKQRMRSAHVTQVSIIDKFDLTTERFRPAPAYRFAELPNDGQLYYARYEWGLTGETWLRLANAALTELGLTEEPC